MMLVDGLTNDALALPAAELPSFENKSFKVGAPI